eukprot:gb/GECH01012048.1/.p1 GENE.gb/GECH01012048.1/~~gb/GECH01012048.1/.p1  ORF type:complete len:205 (+),score=33.30 gb/GECH01012048.1/:1-615(+)
MSPLPNSLRAGLWAIGISAAIAWLVIYNIRSQRRRRRRGNNNINHNTNNADSFHVHPLNSQQPLTTEYNRSSHSLNSNKPIITCFGFDNLFTKKNEDIQFVSDDVVERLRFLVESNDVYLVNRVSSDIQEEQILSLLNTVGMVESGLETEKILFCETAKGECAMVQQLEPDVHISGDKVNGEYAALSRFARKVVQNLDVVMRLN